MREHDFPNGLYPKYLYISTFIIFQIKNLPVNVNYSGTFRMHMCLLFVTLILIYPCVVKSIKTFKNDILKSQAIICVAYRAQLRLKTYFTSQQWPTKSQVALLTNCFGFPSAPWVNYVSFKYFVPAEYSPLSGGLLCWNPTPTSDLIFPSAMYTHVFDYPSRLVRQVERKRSPARTCPIPKIPHLITDLHRRK